MPSAAIFSRITAVPIKLQMWQAEHKAHIKQRNFTIQTVPGGCTYLLSPPPAEVTTSKTLNIKRRELANTKQSKIEIYPNPTTQNWIVETINFPNKNSPMKLSDITGRIIWQQKVSDIATKKMIVVPASNLPNGTYLLSLQINGLIQTFKLIKN